MAAGAVTSKANGQIKVDWYGTTDFLAAGADPVTGTTSAVSARLHVVVTPSGVVNADLNADTGPSYRLHTKKWHGGGDGAAREVSSAFVTQNWAGLYQLEAGSIQATVSQANFVTTMGQQTATIGQLTSMQPLTSGSEVTNDLGQHFFLVPVSVTKVDPAGVASMSKWHLSFIFESGSWKFWASKPLQ